MFRRFIPLVLIACVVTPILAQTPQGWRLRVDRSLSAEDPDDRPDLKVVTRGAGFQVTGGPAGTFWQSARTATGNYTAKATFTLLKPSGHTNYYGLIFGGSDLEGAKQAYAYFLVAQDGTYIIRKRVGETVTDVQRSTMHAAVTRPDKAGRSTNTVELRVADNMVSYLVNGTVVHTSPKSAVTTDGIVGVRVNHQLDVLIEDFQVNKT